MEVALVLACVGLLAISGVPGLFVPRGRKAGQAIATIFVIAGAAAGAIAILPTLAREEPVATTLSWGAIVHGVHVDALSAWFVLPVLLIASLGSVYGHGYWPERDHPETGRLLRFFYGLTVAGMVLVMVAGSGLLFLMGWEIASLAAYFLVTTEDGAEEVRRSGLVYLVATHTATLALFALFVLFPFENEGTLPNCLLVPLGPPPGLDITNLETAIFLLALFGFGVKAGVMPLHVWLPGAHASAPSHVSALMSGVLIKMGIYGLLRVLSLVSDPPAWWGATILALGAVSGVLGVAFAIGQHDLKRLLAYHSVENIGIIFMGMGLGMLGVSLGKPEWAVLGMAGALLHVWNHALFKSLLFLCAGSVVHATGTRQMDRLGGLAKLMPRTAALFLIGAVAISGLPPLNGFVSELLIYLGLFRTLGVPPSSRAWIAGALGAPALALIGALALACFVKAFGAVFLGEPRTDDGRHTHEAGTAMLVPCAVLAAACAAIGLAPALIAPALQHAVSASVPSVRAEAFALLDLAPLALLSALGFSLVGIVLTIAIFLGWRLRCAPREVAVTWDCGYAAPSARMQYTSSSTARGLVGLFAWALRPETHGPGDLGTFPRPSRYESHVPEAVLDRLLLPVANGIGEAFRWARYLQRGRIHIYMLYIVVTLVGLLLLAIR